MNICRTCFVGALAAPAALFASTPGTSVSLHADRMPLETAFRMVVAQTGLNYIYSPAILAGRTVDVQLQDCPLDRALDTLFAGTGIKWTRSGRNVTLRSEPTDHARRESRVILSGFVREGGSGEALIGAVVSDSLTHTSVTTNTSGFYTIEVAPSAQTSLRVQYPGFEPVTTGPLDLNGGRRLDFDMHGSHLLGEVVVTADALKSPVSSSGIGHIKLQGTTISATPVIFGESDVVKTLQLQPGVSAGIEGFAGMYVHGGNNDENMFMLDNVPVYQVNHMAGLLSAFNSSLIKNVEFYKTSFPARYNGRLSSVIEVNTKEGSLTAHHGSARVGLTSGAFDINGPIVRGRTSYSFAMRRTWYDLIARPILAIVNANNDDGEDTEALYNFSDMNAKITHRFNDRSRGYVSAYWGEDYLKGGSKMHMAGTETLYEDYHDRQRLRWGNVVASAGWEYAVNDRFYSRVIASFNHHSSTLQRTTDDVTGYEQPDSLVYSSQYANRMANNISDWGLRADMEWSPRSEHKVEFGATYTLHRFTPRDYSSSFVTLDGDSLFTRSLSRVRSHEASVYASDDWRISDALRADIGLNIGMFATNGNFHAVADPRLALRWRIADNFSLKASYARMSQYVHQLTESSISLPTDQWVPVDGTLKPQRSDQAAIGAAWNPGGSFVFEAEAYYKRMRDIVDYRYDYYIIPETAPWHERLCSGKGRAYGIDLLLSRTVGRVTGHIAYSLLWADRQFADRNRGHRYPARFDNRHKINILVNWRINSRWDLNAAWTGMSGNRITLSTQDYDMLQTPDMPWIWGADGSLDLPGSPNNYRLPFYHRLDLSAKRSTRHGYWTFSLYNAYCKMNTITIRKKREDLDNPSQYQFQKLKLFPLIPSVSYTWLF